MCAKTDVNTLNWTDEEPQPATKSWGELPHTTSLTPLPVVTSLKPRIYHQFPQPDSLEEHRDLLRNEINRGKEYLLQVQAELRENRELLEHWAQYERTCSLQPLDHLVQSVWLKSKVEEFLIEWLAKRERRLVNVSRKIRLGMRSTKTNRTKKAKRVF